MATEAMNEFYEKYPTAVGHLTWETFKNDPDNSEFRDDDSDDDSDDDGDDDGLFVPQE